MRSIIHLIRIFINPISTTNGMVCSGNERKAGSFSADLYYRSSRFEDIRFTMYGGIFISHFNKFLRNYCVNKLPWIRMTRATSIKVIVGNRSVSVRRHTNHWRSIYFSNKFSSTDIRQRIGHRFYRISQTHNRIPSYRRHCYIRMFYHISISPFMIMSLAIHVSIGVNHTTVTIRNIRRINIARRQHSATIIRHRGQNTGSVYFRRTIHRIATGRSRNRKVCRCNMVNITPRIFVAVNLIFIDVGRITTTVNQRAYSRVKRQSNRITAVGNDWLLRYRFCHLICTINRSRFVRFWRE